MLRKAFKSVSPTSLSAKEVQSVTENNLNIEFEEDRSKIVIIRLRINYYKVFKNLSKHAVGTKIGVFISWHHVGSNHYRDVNSLVLV